jgi:hypothetical protein
MHSYAKYDKFDAQIKETLLYKWEVYLLAFLERYNYNKYPN